MDNKKREEFNNLINDIYAEARKKDCNMQISNEAYDFILDYGKMISEEFYSICDSAKDSAKAFSHDEKTFFTDQVCSYLEYYQAICSLWELCATEVPAVEKLVRGMDQVFISNIDPRT